MTTLRALATVFNLSFCLCVVSVLSCAQDPVKIQVQFDHAEVALSHTWNYFGYDEPNYSYANNGKKLLAELSALSSAPTYVRVHNLLTSGDGSASLKWGSTNVYTEDKNGNPIYDWTILDRIFDAFHDVGIKPIVELGFMPEALSTNPRPYRHNFPQGTIFTGWAYPPKDYRKWSELIFQLARHVRGRYGENEVNTWLWEVWNEPDIDYWKGTREDYFKLYDYSVDAVLHALPAARVGGPDTTGPSPGKSADYLRDFLDHCAHQKNYVSGKIGSPLHFISFHPKGAVAIEDGHPEMGIAHQLAVTERGFSIVSSFPEWRSTPILLGEFDPEGCAACSARTHPQNAYRNSSLYAAYTVEALTNIFEMARAEHVNLLGAVTWAFEFEEQPYFEGFRTLASNGIDKPVLNAFRTLGLLSEERVKVTSSGSIATAEIAANGVRGGADINAVATRSEHGLAILIWNYSDDDLSTPDALVELSATGLPEIGLPGNVLPGNGPRVLVEHYRVDSTHSNAFTAWKAMGSPQSPSPAQYQQLEDAGQLQLLDSPAWIPVGNGAVRLRFTLPRQGLSLIRLTWK